MLGNAHYNIGKASLEIAGIKLAPLERKYFYSGLVYADVGRFLLDKKVKVMSDSKKFIKKMAQFARTREEKWFCIGAFLHEFQDRRTNNLLRRIFKAPSCGYLSYLKRCGVVEYYFLGRNGEYIFTEDLEIFRLCSAVPCAEFLDSNELLRKLVFRLEKEIMRVVDVFYSCYSKVNLNLPDNILKKAYKYYGFNATSYFLKEQSVNTVITSVLLCYFVQNKKNTIGTIPKNIERETLRFGKECAKFLKRKLYFSF